MPAGHAGRLVWESRTHPIGDANLPTISPRTNRGHSAEGYRRARRSSGGRFARYARDNARNARSLDHFRWHTIDDHLSSGVLVAEPVAFRKKKSLGRHAPSPGTSRKINQRKATQLFSLA